MKKQHLFFLLLFPLPIFTIFGCKKDIQKLECSNNHIVLIFDTIKKNYDTLAYPNGGEMIKSMPVLTFKSEVQGEYLAPIMKIKTDTIVLSTESDYLFIFYRYNPISGLNFIIHKGDTVIINEKHNTPFLTVLNRKAKEFDINYDFWKKARYGSVYDYNTEDYYNNPQSLFYMMKGISWQTGKESAAKKLIKELNDENEWLDSLYNNKLLSEYEYNIYDTRNKYKLLTLELENKDTLTLKGYLKEYNDSIYKNDYTGFYSSFYWHCLGIYMDQLTNQSFDYRQLFDMLDAIDINLGTLSKQAKLAYLDQIINNSSIDLGQKYYNKLAKTINDPNLLSKLSKKYQYLFDESINNSEDIELQDQSGNRLNLSSIIKKHRGKTIYVDFWASWCIPCLQEMPASKKLRELYRGQNIVFVYLAINDKEITWKNAFSTAELNDTEDNYLILNNKTSTILKELNISSIPRYIIYDKNGKLIHKNAPRPSSQQIKKLLTIY